MWLQVRSTEFKDPLKIDNISRCFSVKRLKSLISEKSGIKVNKQQLIFLDKILKNDFTLYDYGVNINDVIQLFVLNENEAKQNGGDEPEQKKVKFNTEVFEKNFEETKHFRVGDIVDVREVILGSWFEAEILKITLKPNEKLDQDRDESKFLFYIKYLDEPNSDSIPVSSENMRFRSCKQLSLLELTDVKEKVLVNYNADHPELRGNWFDALITSVDVEKSEVIAEVFLTSDQSTSMKNVKINFKDEIFQIETNLRHENLNFEAKNLRQNKPHCDDCQDKEGVHCKSCNCCLCGSPDNPDQAILCDECDQVFHMACLNPPLESCPTGDWFCPDCKNESEDSAMVKKKGSQSKRDWGKGMACVSRSTICTSVPPNHFGKIPGVPVGTTWLYRMQVSESGIHRPHVAGISGRSNEGSFSLVLSGGYEDDVDNGNEFYYTGSGGRDLSGNKRVNVQSCDQTLTAQNGALARNCNLGAQISTTEAFEAKNWKAGLPVRVVRSSKLKKHSQYAPEEGNRYDGIYKVVKYWPEKGKSGFVVWRYLLRRDDSEPAPWTEEGKKRSEKLGMKVIYPPGYVAKTKESPSKQKKGTEKKEKGAKPTKKSTIKSNGKAAAAPEPAPKHFEIESEILALIKQDLMNIVKWKDITAMKFDSYSDFIAEITDNFTCICCYRVVSSPITLPACLHNVCKACLDFSVKISQLKCPVCTQEFKNDSESVQVNQTLDVILKKIFSD